MEQLLEERYKIAREMSDEPQKLSEYEKIREMSIKKRNDALAGFNWKPFCG